MSVEKRKKIYQAIPCNSAEMFSFKIELLNKYSFVILSQREEYNP